MKYPNYKTPKKEGDHFQFSFKLKDSVEKTISKSNEKKKAKKNSEISKKRHNSMPEMYPSITQEGKGDNICNSNEDELLCELLRNDDEPKKRTFNLDYFRQVYQEYIAKNGRQYVQTGYYEPLIPNRTSLLYGSS